MLEPVSLTGAALMAIAASKFVGKAAEKLGEVVAPAALKQAGKQVDEMWQRMKGHLAGNQKAERAITQTEASGSRDRGKVMKPANEAIAGQGRWW